MGMDIYSPFGSKVKFTGCDDMQVNFGGHDDPRVELTVGEIYKVNYTEVHNSYTHVTILGYSGKFNSVCFENV